MWDGAAAGVDSYSVASLQRQPHSWCPADQMRAEVLPQSLCVEPAYMSVAVSIRAHGTNHAPHLTTLTPRPTRLSCIAHRRSRSRSQFEPSLRAWALLLVVPARLCELARHFTCHVASPSALTTVG